MNGSLALQKITFTATRVSTRISELCSIISKILSLSLADERIYPKKRICVAIEKGSFSIALGAQLLSRIRIRGCTKFHVDKEAYPTPDNFASTLAFSLSKEGASKKQITLSVPKAWTVIRSAEFPSTIKENIAEVISYELDRVTPLRSEDAYYDFRILHDDGQKLTLLIAAARSDLITQYTDALRDNGLDVSKVTLNLSSVGTLCHKLNPKETILLVDIINNSYEGALLLEGNLTTAFSGTFAANDDKLKAESIMSEIEHIRATFQQHGGPSQVILSLKENGDVLKKAVQEMASLPVTMLGETDIELKLPSDRKEVSYAALGGLVESLWPKAKGLNLLSKGHREKTRTPLALTMIFLLALLGMLVIYSVAPLQIEEKKLNEITRQINQRKNEIKKIEALNKEIDAVNAEITTINDFRENKPLAINMLRELSTILPKNTWLTRVRIGESTVEIEGFGSSATQLVPVLEASKYFEKVEFSSPTFRDVRMNADRFNIKMAIEGLKKEEVEKVKHDKK